VAELRILVAGGTIDAREYDFARGKVLSFGNPAVEQILRTGRVRDLSTATRTPADETADILLVGQKDSLEMTDADRQRIVSLVVTDPRERILITHGTDTMQQTGALIAAQGLDKTVVLTGAMRPFLATDSDAAFNLGGALVACRTLPHGVYIVIQGEVFPVDSVRKVREGGGGYFTRT
jgi:L-asparaginase